MGQLRWLGEVKFVKKIGWTKGGRKNDGDFNKTEVDPVHPISLLSSVLVLTRLGVIHYNLLLFFLLFLL